MNPTDPNQPTDQPQPATPNETPAPEATPTTETPAPYAEAPVTTAPEPSVAPVEATTAPNPFGAASASADPAVVPGAPVTTPVGSSPNSNPVSSLMNGPKKKLIVLIAIIVGALIVLGIAAFVVMNFLLVSKADYRAATTQFNTVSSAYSALNSSASTLQYDTSSSTTDTEFTNDSDAVTSKLKTFQDANAKFATLKAVKSGDGKKLYDTYDTKVKAFAVYAKDLVTSLKSYRPAAKACSDATTLTLLSSCVTALNAVGEIPNADLKQFVTVLQPQYKAYLDVKTKIAAITDPYGKQYDQYKTLRDQGYAIQDKISAAGSDFSSNAKKHGEEIDPASAANALGEYLVKKAN
jgi:hypothetical protein